MKKRSLFCICCVVSLISIFTPDFIKCMDDSPEIFTAQDAELGETSPMAVDPSIFGAAEQVVSSFTSSGGSEAIVFHVSTEVELEVGIQALIQLSKNQSPEAQQQCQSLAVSLIKGIEKIYGPKNVVNIRDAIQRTRSRIVRQNCDRRYCDSRSLELSQAFDSYLDKYNEKIRLFAIRNSCAPCLIVALFSFIFYILMIQEHHL